MSSIERVFFLFCFFSKAIGGKRWYTIYKLSHSVQYPIAKLVLRYMTSRNITQTF